MLRVGYPPPPVSHVLPEARARQRTMTRLPQPAVGARVLCCRVSRTLQPPFIVTIALSAAAGCREPVAPDAPSASKPAPTAKSSAAPPAISNPLGQPESSAQVSSVRASKLSDEEAARVFDDPRTPRTAENRARHPSLCLRRKQTVWSHVAWRSPRSSLARQRRYAGSHSSPWMSGNSMSHGPAGRMPSILALPRSSSRPLRTVPSGSVIR